ncbi:uncharacterized protein UTRI_00466 [Ustilago trichophora]|uniref:Uncharacterized protein n=1 Tax=Ustilago trichophora TaxID=86804 RepID=A0A5C3DVD1_9BASI|nr:uncharacterized protein UTRI_00466 [Ustilago trichophora]
MGALTKAVVNDSGGGRKVRDGSAANSAVAGGIDASRFASPALRRLIATPYQVGRSEMWTRSGFDLDKRSGLIVQVPQCNSPDCGSQRASLTAAFCRPQIQDGPWIPKASLKVEC